MPTNYYLIMQTDILRKQIKELRNSLDKNAVIKYSKIITDKILALKEIENLNTFMVYKSFKNEVSTESLINLLLSLNKTVCYPVTKGENMVAGLPLSNEFTISKLGVEEPKNYKAIDLIDCVIVPLIACDKNKNRIGFGKGYYDRFLKNRNTLKIGVCYDFQVVDEITPNEWDVPLDLIITEKQIIGD